MKAYIRTVKEGSVRVNGWYYCPGEPYRDELEGQRLVFTEYPGNPPFLGLWGSESLYRGTSNMEDEPNLIDGAFYWQWWRVLPEEEIGPSGGPPWGDPDWTVC